MALQGHEQTLMAQQSEEKMLLDHAQAFLSQRGRGRGRRGAGGGNGRGQFNSRGRVFTPAGRFGAQNGGNNALNKFAAGGSNISNGENNQKANTNLGQPRQNNSNTTGDGNKIVCQICGKTNHLAVDCWYMFDFSYQLGASSGPCSS